MSHSDLCALAAVSDLCRLSSSNNIKVFCRDWGEKMKNMLKNTLQVDDGFNCAKPSVNI